MKPEITPSEISLSHNEARKIIIKKYGDLKPNQVVHHIDFNPLNNSLDNLQIMDEPEHLRLHRKSKKENSYILKTDSARLTFDLPLSLLKKIEDQAQANERDVSKEIRFTLKKYFEKGEKA